MEAAPDLIELGQRLFDALVQGDFESMKDMHSKHEALLVIGTDAREWWAELDSYMAIVALQHGELGVRTWEMSNTVAWKEGNFGWVAGEFSVTMNDHDPFAGRVTIVFRREGAYWRIIHFHSSIPVANEEQFGYELTTSLDSMLTMAHDEHLSFTSANGTVVLMFTDIEGSTVLLEALGEARWIGLHGWHDEIVRQQVAMFGGSVIKGQGDGFMVTFPAPGAAVAAAQGIQRALAVGFDGIRVPVRIGIHSGNAHEEAGDFFGKTVVVAARVASHANGGEILVTDGVASALTGAFVFGEGTTLSLKGLSDPYDVRLVDWS